jgi:signal transduction histidine kinase
VDIVPAVVVATVQLAGTAMYAQDEPSPWALDAGAYALLLAGPLALLGRRRWPEATLVVAAVAAAGYAATGYPRGPVGYPAFACALVSAILMGRRRWAWGVLAATYPALAWLPSITPDEVEATRSLADKATDLLWLPLLAAAAELARIALERREEAARSEREDARRRASEERLRIARELHDVLAHNIALINVQSGVALHLLDERPEHARPALEAVHEASGAALGELRSVLDVLRRGLDDGGPGAAEHDAWAPRAPTTGLRDLDGLVRRTRAAGLDVALVVEGGAAGVPAGVDLAAFRIVQEALTNAVRHAPGARATVRVVHAADELVVWVDDDGGTAGTTGRGDGRAGAAPRPTAGQPGSGRGLAGMGERARALGGTFAAGRRPDHGFRVEARLPIGEPAG